MPRREAVEHRRNLCEEVVEHNPSREAKHDHDNYKFILSSICCSSAVVYLGVWRAGVLRTEIMMHLLYNRKKLGNIKCRDLIWQPMTRQKTAQT